MTITKWIWRIERFIIKPRCDKCSVYKKVESPERTTQTHSCPLMGYVQSWSNCMYYERKRREKNGR